METKAEVSKKVADLVYRLQKSKVSISVNDLNTFQLSDDLKDLLKAIILSSNESIEQMPVPQLLGYIENSGLEISHFEDIVAALEIKIQPPEQKITQQTIHHQFNFFAQNVSDTPNKKDFDNCFGMPNEFPDFTGREETLKEFDINPSQYVVSGTPGVGKTQLVLAAAYRQLALYKATGGKKGCRSVIWFIAGTDEGVDNHGLMMEQCHRLGEQLGFDPKQLGLNDLMRVIFKKLAEEHGPYMVVYDNARDFRSIKPFFVPHSTPAFITTRNNNIREWGLMFQLKTVSIFSEVEALDYLKKLMNRNAAHLYQENEARKLAKALGFFPLALTQAIAYIIAESISISAYLDAFEEKKAQYLQEPVDQADPYQGEKNPSTEVYDPQKATIWAVIQLSLKKVLSSNANQILKACAYLAPEAPIDVNFLAYWTADGGECRKAVAVLRRYSLIENVKLVNHVRIHQLVQDILKLEDNHETQGIILSCLANFMLRHFSIEENPLIDEERKKNLFPHVEGVLEQLQRVQVEPDLLYAPEMAMLRHCLGSIYQMIGNPKQATQIFYAALKVFEDTENLDMQLITLGNLGTTTLESGNAQEAKKWFERAFTIITESLPDSPHLAAILMGLGLVSRELGDALKAKEYLERANAIFENNDGSKHYNVAVSLTNLGTTHVYLGNFSEAKKLLERALTLQEGVFGRQHSGVAKILINLASVHLSLGQQKTAKSLLERALSINEKLFGPDSHEVALVLVNLGNVLLDLRDSVQAKKNFERALNIDRQFFGSEHPNIVKILSSLGRVSLQSGDTQSAITLLEDGVSRKESLYGTHHVEVATTLVNLAQAKRVEGKAAEAKKHLERALSIFEGYYGANHSEVVTALMNLSNVLSDLGDDAKAEELLERALVIQENSLGKNHPQVAKILANLGGVTRDFSNPDKAKVYLDRALVIQEEDDPESPEIAITLMNLGNTQADLGNPVKAKELLVRALVIQEKKLGSTHPEVAKVLANLANVFDELGDSKNAKSHLLRALSIHERYFGDTHPGLIKYLINLSAQYRKLREFDNAEECCRRALDIQESSYNSEHPMRVKILTTSGNLARDREDLKAAIAFLERALTLGEHIFGNDHLELAKILDSLAECYLLQGEELKARVLYKRCLAINEKILTVFEQKFGLNHLKVAEILVDIGSLAMGLDDPMTSIAQLRRALVIKEQHYGSEHCELGVILSNLGAAAHKLGDLKGAKEFYERLLAIYEQKKGRDHVMVALTRFMLAIILYKLGHGSVALLHFQDCVRVFNMHCGSQDLNTLRAQKMVKMIQENKPDSRLESSSSSSAHSVNSSQAKGLLELLEQPSLLGPQDLFRAAQGCFAQDLIPETLMLLERIPEQELSVSGIFLRAKCQLKRHRFSDSRDTISICLALADNKTIQAEADNFLKQIETELSQIKSSELKLNDMKNTLSEVDVNQSIREKIKIVSELCSLRHFDEALTLINEIISKRPTNNLLAPLYYHQARCYFALQHYREAQKSCLSSLHLKEESRVSMLYEKVLFAIEVTQKLDELSQLGHPLSLFMN